MDPLLLSLLIGGLVIGMVLAISFALLGPKEGRASVRLDSLDRKSVV